MKAITCAFGLELLVDYLEGALSADVHAALEEHVAGCPRCVAFVASYCDTPRILREATAATLPLRRDIAQRQLAGRQDYRLQIHVRSHR